MNIRFLCVLDVDSMEVDNFDEFYERDVHPSDEYCSTLSEMNGSESEIPMEIDVSYVLEDQNEEIESLMDVDTSRSSDELVQDSSEDDLEHPQIRDVEMHMGSPDELTPEELELYNKDWEDNREAADRAALELAEQDSDDLYESS